jgi:hypothetical protein
MNISYENPLYLHCDSKTDYFPSPVSFKAKRRRTRRSSRFDFQTADTKYFVHVTVIYSDDPEEVFHQVKIVIDDDFEEFKQTSFIRNDGRLAGLPQIRELAHIHLFQHVELN